MISSGDFWKFFRQIFKLKYPKCKVTFWAITKQYFLSKTLLGLLLGLLFTLTSGHTACKLQRDENSNRRSRRWLSWPPVPPPRLPVTQTERFFCQFCPMYAFWDFSTTRAKAVYLWKTARPPFNAFQLKNLFWTIQIIYVQFNT